MRTRYFVGQKEHDGIMIIGGFESYEKAEIERDNFNKGILSFEGQQDPDQYPYQVFEADEYETDES